MQNAGIRIAHSLAVFEMRDCSPTVNDRYAPASGPSCCRAETGSTPDDCAYYSVADGDGQTTAACEAGVDVHLAHKAEHAVDLETGAVVGVTVQDADEGDTATSIETLIEAAKQVEP